MMKKMFNVLGDFPYNIFMHYLPKDMEVEFHFHAEIQPRLKREASVEFGYGTKVNTILPEHVAKLLRDAK